MSDTLRINPSLIVPPRVVPPPNELEDLRDALADAEPRINQLETAHALMLESLIEANHRIERLETAMVAVVHALSHGETTYPGERHPHQHALCGLKTARYLVIAAVSLNIDIGLLDEERD